MTISFVVVEVNLIKTTPDSRFNVRVISVRLDV
jgi:hypothetical protein